MRKFTLSIIYLSIAASIQAQIIHVPADYPAIQQAIDAAANGDTVLVSDGTYFEQINFLGKKPLMIASEFLLDGDTSHITNTIIDGSQPTNPDSASVVYFTSGEDTTSVLCGFTITGGRGTLIITPDSLWGIARQGGGIWISGSGAKILYNRITKNRCLDLTNPGVLGGPVGGGISTDLELEDYWIVIENNVIDSNSLVSNNPNGGCTGAGIAIFRNNRITSNIIKNNTSKIMEKTAWWSQGTGACVFGFEGFNNHSVIRNNLFINNVNNSDNAFGGGMKVGGVTLTCSNNQFIGNSLISSIGSTAAWGAGLEAGDLLPGSVISGNLFQDNYSVRIYAGMFIYPGSDTVLVESNYFINNIAEINGGGCGINSHPALLQNNVFSGNRAGQRGGAIYLEKSSTLNVVHLAVLINNSFFGNKASQGGAIFSSRSHPVIINSVFWSDTAVMGKEILCFSSDTVEVAYSNINPEFVFGNFHDAGGNISQDPLFDDLVLLTIPTISPCCNTGTEHYTCGCSTLFPCPDYDILGTPRPQNELVDMGAYELMLTGQGEDASDSFNTMLKIYPDPCFDRVTISLSAVSGKTKVSVFNVSGEKVLERQLTNTVTQLDISALPPGFYIVRLTHDKIVATGKFIKL